MLGSLGFALLAGLVSILSPCVLPLVPLVLGAALSEHRLGPAALATGLALSFTAVGLFIATLGFAMGLDAEVFRTIASVVMIVIGMVMTVPVLQLQFASFAGPIGNRIDNRFRDVSSSGLSGQFGVGVLLGIVWSPCVGPTLGAASILASRSESLGSVAAIMLTFGIGAALPMLLIGTLSRRSMNRWRGRMMAAGSVLKMAMGLLLVFIGGLILSGADKYLEAWLVEMSPQWLTTFTTGF